MTQHLEELLETLVRPALREHGGDVELVSYADGILRLKMLGSRRDPHQRDPHRGPAQAPSAGAAGSDPGPRGERLPAGPGTGDDDPKPAPKLNSFP